MARQHIIGGLTPTYLNETQTSQSIVNTTYIDMNVGAVTHTSTLTATAAAVASIATSIIYSKTITAAVAAVASIVGVFVPFHPTLLTQTAIVGCAVAVQRQINKILFAR